MKTLLTLTICIGLALHTMAQAPQGFNYQAVLRNAEGQPITEQNVSILLTIQNENGTTEYYSETHSLTTSPQGVISVAVGRGSGSTGSLTDIPWESGGIHLKVEVDPAGGTTYNLLGTSPLLAVPYALYARSATEVVVPPNAGEDEPLFVVRNSAGQIVFAVYQTGVRVYVDDTGKKSTRGGFAIGGLSDQNKEGEAEYMRVTPDSARIYLRSNPEKQTRGGFAIGGLSDQIKIPAANFLHLTTDNYFIGHNSGQSATTGLYNATMGYESGFSINSGSSNSFMGYQSGYNNQGGSGNIFLGYQTGYENVDGSYNTFLGYRAGYSNTDGVNNSFLGSFAGQNNQTGNYNTFIGDSTGFYNTVGNNNSFIGTKAGLNNIDGYNNSFIGNYTGHSNSGGFSNVFIGNSSGFSNVDAGGNVFIGNESGFLSSEGWNNVYIGTYTGYNNIDGQGNLFLGYQAGKDNEHGTRNIFIGNNAGVNEMGSNLLYITNWGSDSTSSIIWGRMGYDLSYELGNHKLRFNSRVGIFSEPDPGYILTIEDTPWQNSAASIKLYGAGDGYNYSTLSLSSKGLPLARHWQLSHSKNEHKLQLYYYDGIDQWHARLIIDTLGTISSNGNMAPLHDNAFSLGTSENKWTAVYATEGTIQTSDIRLKTNIVPLAYGLSQIMKLNPITYSWLSSNTNAQKIGLIAQEVDEVISEVVNKGTDESQTMGINYSDLVPVLIKGIQEQQEIIERQQIEIEMLKSSNRELQSLKFEIEAIKALINK